VHYPTFCLDAKGGAKNGGKPNRSARLAAHAQQQLSKQSSFLCFAPRSMILF
jgi:hypothetical protein